MPPLPGFTSNPLRTRSDLVRAANALVHPLHSCKSPNKARVRLPYQTGAGFDEVSAQLEGFARPLFAIAPLLLNKDGEDHSSCLWEWIDGIAAGVDPSSDEYWGDIGDIDQRMVETESIALLVLLAPATVLGLGDLVVGNLTKWLRGIHNKRMPVSNWRWFRVFVNLALVQVLGIPEAEIIEEMKSDLAVLDSFYLGQGWNSDGPWGEGNSQADYYSGSFAIQFSHLLFVHLAEDETYRERKEDYRAQARDFGAKFWRFFDQGGAAIPFGRSMTYRFAFAAFWAVAALARVDLEPPLSIGVVKGLLLRHLRWWADEERASIFQADGTLTIGYAYPNMYLGEDYNSPQSPYWCLKSFLVLALPDTDTFWTTQEQDYPTTQNLCTSFSTVVEPPKQIVVNDPNHHYLLSSGQFTTKSFKAREAKYCKFAYSSSVGFSVPTGTLLHQLAPDSTLSVRFAHDDFWRTRSNPRDVSVTKCKARKAGTEVSCLTSTWIPWQRQSSFKIITTLIPPPDGELSGWHIRLHRLCGSGQPETNDNEVEVIDAGFSIPCLGADGRFIPSIGQNANGLSISEGAIWDTSNALIACHTGASGVKDLTQNLRFGQHSDTGRDFLVNSEAAVMRPDPNTNLIFSRTMVPYVRHTVSLQKLSQRDLYVATAVFCIKPSSTLSMDEIQQLWRTQPSLAIDCHGKLDIAVET